MPPDAKYMRHSKYPTPAGASRAKPVHHLFTERVDTRAAGVKVDVSLLISGAPLVEQTFELGAIRGERTSAVHRQARDDAFQRHVEPYRYAVGVDRGAIGGIDERTAARGHDGVRRS